MSSESLAQADTITQPTSTTQFIRTRPSMYIGYLDGRGLHYMISELLTNAVQELAQGHGDTIEVLLEKSKVTIKDNGRGLPLKVGESSHFNGLESAFTEFKESPSGFGGMGGAIVGALSKELSVRVQRDGYEWIQSFHAGVATGPVNKGPATQETGTRISFEYDKSILKPHLKFNPQKIAEQMENLSYFLPHIKFILAYEENRHCFSSQQGLADLALKLARKQPSVLSHPLVIQAQAQARASTASSDSNQEIYIECALSWISDMSSTQEIGFINYQPTPLRDGVHIHGVRTALRRSLQIVGEESGMIGEADESIRVDDIRAGLIAIVRVRHPNPEYQGWDKIKLINQDISEDTVYLVEKACTAWLRDYRNREDVKALLTHVLRTRDHRT